MTEFLRTLDHWTAQVVRSVHEYAVVAKQGGDGGLGIIEVAGLVIASFFALFLIAVVILGVPWLRRFSTPARRATGDDVIVGSRLIGRIGVTTSEVQPAGTAVIDGTSLDVVTEGPALDKGATIQVTATIGNRSVVSPRRLLTARVPRRIITSDSERTD